MTIEDDRINDIVRQVIDRKVEELLDDMKNEAPTLHPDTRCDTEVRDEWISGDTVDLREWR